MHTPQQTSNASVQPARGSHSVRLVTILTAALAVAGMLLLAHSDVAAQSGSEAPKTAAGAPAGNSQHGKTLYVTVGCYECHGYAGQGGRDGARISTIALTPQALIRYVRAPVGAMPAYTDKVISDQELTDIHAYLQTLPKAKPAKDIPLLNDLLKK